jgi:hypothetical protein
MKDLTLPESAKLDDPATSSGIGGLEKLKQRGAGGFSKQCFSSLEKVISRNGASSKTPRTAT